MPEQVGSKMAIVCCGRLLLAHSANFIKLTFVVVTIFLVRLFCAPSSAAPGGNCPLCSPSHATAVFGLIRMIVVSNRST